MACDRDLSTNLCTHLFGRYHEALHALSGMDKQFWQGAPVGMQPNIGCMLEYLIGFLRHHFFILPKNLFHAAIVRPEL